MRRLSIVQELATSVERHWRIFFDDDYERALYAEGLRFPRYELVESKKVGALLHRKIRVVPRLDAPGPVLKLLGSSFGYTEESSFDEQTGLLRCKVVPNVLGDRLGSEFSVRAEPLGADRCRRSVDIAIDARIFGVGSLVEAAFEKSMRDGWRDSAAFMTEWLRRHPEGSN